MRGKLLQLERETVEWMPVVGHTHDEIVVECDEADEADTRRILGEIMAENDEWNEGLPLAVDVKSSWYYTKSLD